MASTQQLEGLKAVLSRLNSTATKDIPLTLHTLTSILLRCEPTISASYDDPKTKATQAAQLVGRFRKHVGLLLNEKTIEGRLGGVVLAKTAVEAGGYEMLKSSGNWIRALLSILTKPDPLTTKRLAIITLTKTCVGLQAYTTLMREIGTPGLKSFVPACLNLVASKSSTAKSGHGSETLLGVILESFARLVPRHPTIFRSFHEQILSLVRPLTTGEDTKAPTETTRAAQRLFALLHFTAAKQGQSTQWKADVSLVIDETHAVVSRVYRSIIEDWQSITGAQAPQTERFNSEPMLDSGAKTPASIEHACGRLRHLLGTLSTLCQTNTAAAVTLPVGSIIDLLNRVFAAVCPRNKGSGPRPNDQFTLEERSALFSELPLIHVAALKTLRFLVELLGPSTIPIALSLMDQLYWIFEHESDDESVRREVFTITALVLDLAGPSFRKEHLTSIHRMAHVACTDIFSDGQLVSSENGAPQAKPNGLIALDVESPTVGRGSAHRPTSQRPQIQRRASSFLTALLSRVPDTFVPRSLRASIDRSAILASDKALMIASVLSCSPSGTGKANSSILVFLARAYPQDPVVESILRPRMPIVMTGTDSQEFGTNSDDEDMHMQETSRQNGYQHEKSLFPTAGSEPDSSPMSAQGDPPISETTPETALDVSQDAHDLVDPALDDIPTQLQQNGSQMTHSKPPKNGITTNSNDISTSISTSPLRKRTSSDTHHPIKHKRKRVHFELDDNDVGDDNAESDTHDIAPEESSPKEQVAEDDPEPDARNPPADPSAEAVSKSPHSILQGIASDSDEDSDFEIPKLILKGAEGDSDFDSEEGDYEVDADVDVSV